MKEITLKKPKVQTLRVNIGDTVVEIPLGNSVPYEEQAALATFEGTVAFYKRYIPKAIAKTLTVEEYNQITAAWLEATREASGMTPGES